MSIGLMFGQSLLTFLVVLCLLLIGLLGIFIMHKITGQERKITGIYEIITILGEKVDDELRKAVDPIVVNPLSCGREDVFIKKEIIECDDSSVGDNLSLFSDTQACKDFDLIMVSDDEEDNEEKEILKETQNAESVDFLDESENTKKIIIQDIDEEPEEITVLKVEDECIETICPITEDLGDYKKLSVPKLKEILVKYSYTGDISKLKKSEIIKIIESKYL